MAKRDPGPWGDRPPSRTPRADFLGEQSMASQDGGIEQAVVRLVGWLGRRRAERKARLRRPG